ncbi:PREDICTED: pentatricopeptide repeat-containing protein At3g60980, mitochondrial-like [Camelina sativa]|uniref:Pentatricopeptide repeat-containing protein At3g60980, mitochondrial-like n=1 Tax=Camelina sativa TaxID=90675 RepID=A0ABM1Q6H0_CAMSA|nr:PREDICTED: pentatricopeptide repeat-containing protein At3g60980, mitochondrial-like [Camelina sativa]
MNMTSAFMEYWFEQGNGEEAIKCYNIVKQLVKVREATTVNTLLDLLLKYGRKTEAWSLFNEVLHSEELRDFNQDTLNIMVNECFKMGQFDQAIQTFNKVKASKLKYTLVSCYRNIITRFYERDMLLEAEQFFEELCLDRLAYPDVSIYTTMIDAYLKAGRTVDALRTSDRMVDAFLGRVAWLACL